jgi:hypothetical protein
LRTDRAGDQREESWSGGATVIRDKAWRRHGDVAAQLRSIDAALKTLLRKNTLCDCDCEECLAGDCEDCSDADCTDPNCEGSVKARTAAEQLVMLKNFAVSLKSIAGGSR